jgi:hypothetical protein
MDNLHSLAVFGLAQLGAFLIYLSFFLAADFWRLIP